MQTINVLDKAKAEELKALGFRYTEKRIGDGKTVYVFLNSPETMKAVTAKFTNNDFYFGKTMCF